jgi:two-component system, NtrC family, sensor kinase
MKAFPSTIRGQVIMAFSACFLFMALMIAINYGNFYRLSSSMQFFEIAEELNSSLLEMRRYEKNYFLYQKEHDFEENLTYTNRLALILNRERENLIRSMGKENYARFQKYAGEYSTLMEALRKNPLPKDENVDLQGKIRGTGQNLLVLADQLLTSERREINQRLQRMISFPMLNLVVLVLLLGFVVFFIGEKIIRPLARITRESEAIAQGIFQGKISPLLGSSDNEICRLTAALNRMMTELESRQEQLVQSRKIAAVGTLTSGIAHEINNPINNIVLTLETLAEDNQTMPPEERLQLYQEALDQADRASDIVKNLLEFSRANHPRREEVSLEELIDKTIRLLNNEFKVHRIKIAKEIKWLFPKLLLDKSGLQQVLVNLLLNSIQAMPEGGKLSIILDRVNSEARIDIVDTGPGIPAENLSRIFDPFFSTKKGGTGLGLSVSYNILQNQGGRIEVQSSEGQGTTFSLYLPFHEGAVSV